jgi:hypothetical protein
MKVMKISLKFASVGFSELNFPVFPTTSTVDVGLLSTGKDVEDGGIVCDCRG